MRPGQQNRRPRGRTNSNGSSSNNSNNSNNNNRGRQQNPLARSYESSGPDVKIRGNAQHVAERYAQLARDSLSSGDRVMAENYLQHAEHYNRIIAAAMLQQAQFTEQQRREWDEEGNEGEGEDGDENIASDTSAENGQPTIADAVQPQNGDGQNNNQNNSQNSNRERNNFQARPERQERQPRPERNNQERNNQERNNQERSNQDRSTQDRNNQDRGDRVERQPRAVFVAPLDESQPVIEGTPAEFANAESAGLARTLGLSAGRSEKRVVETAEVADVAVVSDAVAEEAAPKVPRPRRAPRKIVAEVADAAPETAGE
jgi:hypothetical protein